mmetsp:Transcript_15904/g.26632  ORF Transcript_15904/g.26632 Transcript_15904/m.26632 type:complete len:220 (-) Transcript_15904:431-1090(-)
MESLIPRCKICRRASATPACTAAAINPADPSRLDRHAMSVMFLLNFKRVPLLAAMKFLTAATLSTTTWINKDSMQRTPCGPIKAHSDAISSRLMYMSIGRCLLSARAKLFVEGTHISPEFWAEASSTNFMNHRPIDQIRASLSSGGAGGRPERIVPGGGIDVSLKLSNRNDRTSCGKSKDTILHSDCMTRHPTTTLFRMIEGREMSFFCEMIFFNFDEK